MGLEKKNIAYIQTPFHVRTLGQLLNSGYFGSTEWIIFYDKLVANYISKEFSDSRSIEVNLDLTYYGKKKYLSYIIDRIKQGRDLRDKILEYNKKIKGLIKAEKIDNYLCFSEKNILSQLILKNITNQTVAWSIDEGFAHYIKAIKSDFFKKITYNLLTPVVLGFQYQYFRVHGTHRRFNKVVLRVPSKKLYKTSAEVVSFAEMGIDGVIKTEKVYKGDNFRSVLILTLPYENIRSYSQKGTVTIMKLIQELLNLDYSVYVKPHPREDITKYKYYGTNIILLDKEVPFENIDYFQYTFIVSEISSTAIELLRSSYPKEKLIFLNIDIWGKQMKHFFQDTNVLYYGESINKYIK